MRFWQIKHANDSNLADKDALTKDSYALTDNFNTHGLFCFFTIQMRNAFHEWTGKSVKSTTMIATKANYQIPYRHIFNFEIYQPLIAICMRS